MAKTKKVEKDANRHHSRLWVKRQVKTPRRAPKDDSLALFYPFSLCNATRIKMEAFLEVSLVSLTLRSRSVFKYF